MYMNTAYLKNTLIAPRTPADQPDTKTDLKILCCGVYRIYTYPNLGTWRPEGRRDYQLLYFHSGQGHFSFEDNGRDTLVSAGQMVLFRPGDRQVYNYLADDKTEVYWVHFTGGKVLDLLVKYHLLLPSSERTFRSGVYMEYKDLFLKMIAELQLCKDCYEDRLKLLLQEIFLMIRRNRHEKSIETGLQTEMDRAARYFSENYNKDIVIADYAKEHFYSPYYFSRNFKEYTGYTPAQFILSLRISNAQSMLGNSRYSVAKIAELVGYSDPLYFSRMFKKHAGYSPKEYRELLHRKLHTEES